jgi:hypothetical protein
MAARDSSQYCFRVDVLSMDGQSKMCLSHWSYFYKMEASMMMSQTSLKRMEPE